MAENTKPKHCECPSFCKPVSMIAGRDRTLARADENQKYINSRQEMMKLDTSNGKATARI